MKRDAIKMRLFLPLLLIGSIGVNANAEDGSYEQCVLSAVSDTQSSETVSQIRTRCLALSSATDITASSSVDSVEIVTPKKELGAMSNRIKAERKLQDNRFALIAHKQNYILPVTHTSKINKAAYDFAGESFTDELSQTEAKLQVSLKVPLNNEDIFLKNDGLYFGFTLKSWWQIYADNISAPFRETNYQPEVFYVAGLDWHPMGGNTGFTVGIEHQSNGRSQLLSRSWNRVYTSFLYEKDDFAFAFRPWYRLREDEKDDPSDSDGDDNPDIEKYMGHFDLTAAYSSGGHEWTMLLRNNLRSDNKGAVELGWSFPLYGNLKGYVQYFNGYGESLIDYNISQERIGLGILLTDRL
jgi:phospholipase A1